MHESGYDKKVYLPEPTGRKTPMCCKIALDSDLPIPRSGFLTFPFEAYLDSPGRTQHDQRRLVPSALFPDKSKKIISANGSFSRRLLRRNTGGLQIILKSFTVKLIRLWEKYPKMHSR